MTGYLWVSEHKQAEFWSFGDQAAMDGCSVCAQGTISRSSSFTLQICIHSRRAGREGRDSVLWQSPEAPRGEPLLTKTHPSTEAHMHLSAWAWEPSGTPTGSWWQSAPSDSPDLICPVLFEGHILYHPADGKPERPPPLRDQSRDRACTLLVAQVYEAVLWAPRGFGNHARASRMSGGGDMSPSSNVFWFLMRQFFNRTAI